VLELEHPYNKLESVVSPPELVEDHPVSSTESLFPNGFALVELEAATKNAAVTYYRRNRWRAHCRRLEFNGCPRLRSSKRPIGLVLAATVLARHGLNPAEQTRADSEAVRALQSGDDDGPALLDPWAFIRELPWLGGKSDEDLRIPRHFQGRQPLRQDLCRALERDHTANITRPLCRASRFSRKWIITTGIKKNKASAGLRRQNTIDEALQPDGFAAFFNQPSSSRRPAT
jgi:hypothetical protein